MADFNFDEIIERRGTGALKYDALKKRFGRDDLIPLWVADMDFATPDFITDALRHRLDHPLFGYTLEPDDYWTSVIGWMASHHQWLVKREWLTYIPGIVKGIGMVINVFVKDDEKVIIQPPVYHPFRLTTQGNGREVVYNPLRLNADGSYSMDFDNLASVADEKCRLLLLSNPHNPVGITWDHATLERLADFCHSRGILVVSDEIHCDMALWDNRHIPFATVSEKAAACSITFGAPTKTFNIAGIVSSYAIVPDEAIRQRFFAWLTANELNEPTIFAPIATIAAFDHGEPWRQAMLHYVEENIDFTMAYFSQYLPQIVPIRPQASFLVWLDCRKLQMTQQALVDMFVNRAHLALNDGAIFGAQGQGFMRMNVATPRQVLQQAFEQLRHAVDEIA